MQGIEVIGATSPLGVGLVERLSVAGNPIDCIYRDPKRLPTSWCSDPRITLTKLDLDRPFERSSERKGTIIWLAHLDAGRSNANETASNLEAFEQFLSTIDPAVTRKFIFVSSGGSVYGNARSLPIGEEHPRYPISSYGRAKKELEDRLRAFGKDTDIRIAILRPGNIYGFERPERSCKGVVNAFLRSIVDGSEFSLVHGGKTIRDFVHVDDVCDAIVAAIESEKEEVVWNVATGIGTRTIDVLEKIIEISGERMPRVREIENYPTDVTSNVLSIDRICVESSWESKVELSAGLSLMLRNWLPNKREAAGSLIV
jgi:UDP-glucose 4-epimerase